ncbi:MAG TPA: hypothetical protein VG053_01835 [Solirubrobacteraceae bacterium]|nr:hypothetical protein [Solirubrobacteraceae bacterium]
MASVYALLQLRVDVHRHLRVGVADLSHDPLDVEVVCEQSDRDVGAPHRMRGGARQRRQALGGEVVGCLRGGFVDDLRNSLPIHATALGVLH